MVHTASNMLDTMGWGNYAIPFILQMSHWRGKNCNIRYTSISKLGIPPRLIFLSYSFHSWDKGYGEITQARHNYPQSTVHRASNLLVRKTRKKSQSIKKYALQPLYGVKILRKKPIFWYFLFRKVNPILTSVQVFESFTRKATKNVYHERLE